MSAADSTSGNHKHKRRTKKPEVPVHKFPNTENSTNNAPIYKTFSANFHSNRHKARLESFEDISKQKKEEETSLNCKVKRKHLLKENDRIVGENEKLGEQLLLLQNTLTKKESQILKLKDKVSSVQSFNEQLINENKIMKTQYEDILVSLEQFRDEISTKSKCKSCDEFKSLLKKQVTEIEVTKTNNKELSEDLNMLKNVVYRLNIQLERYQNKLQKSNSSAINYPVDPEINIVESQNYSQVVETDVASKHRDHLHIPISWGSVNTHTLGPLLDAYQDTVNEKEEIIKTYEQEFVNFTQKLKNIIDENEMLHNQSIADNEAAKKYKTDLENIQKEMKNTKDQNDLLIKKCALKHDKLQDICKVYDHKIDTMRRDYEVLQEQYHKCRLELSSIQGKFQSLSDANDSLKLDKQNVIPLKVHEASVNECKRLFEELKSQYEVEKNKLQNEIKFLEQQIQDLEARVIELGTEKRELQIKIKSAEKHTKKLEHNLSESKILLTNAQISKDACTRQLTKAVEFGRELVNDQKHLLQQLSTNPKENRVVKQIDSSIMDVFKTQIKTVAKDAHQQLNSLEQRIQEQDLSIETLKKNHEYEVEKLLQEIQNKDEYIAKLIQPSNVSVTPYLLYREKHM